MFTSAFRILTAAGLMGIALYPGAASAGMLRPAALAYSSSNAPSATDPDTTVTFAVTVGAISISAPATADLGAGLPGGKIDGSLGNVEVTDDTAALSAAWTATASSTIWTTGSGATTSTIPASDVTYDPGTVSITGSITTVETPITLSTAAQTVVAATGTGNNTGTWDPALEVSLPSAAVGGTYTGTITDSLS
jgi:hypothetical protein